MDTIEEQRETVIELIKENNYEKLVTYVRENDIILKDLNENSFDILIFAVENNVTTDILNYIIEHSKYDNLDYVINDKNQQKVPLISAIINNNFKNADLLLKNKASINQFDIIYYLFRTKMLNKKNLKYTLSHGFNIKNITPYLINELIETKSNLILYDIFRYYLFNNAFILQFLHMYKNKEPTTTSKLQDILIAEKSRIPINEKMYEKAEANHNDDVVKLLFENDSSEPDTLFYRVNRYDILEKAVKLNDYNFVRNVLNYEDFNFRSINSKKILKEANKNRNMDIMKLLIRESINNTSSDISFSSIATERSLEYHTVYYLNYIINMAIKIGNFEMVKYLIEGDEFKSYVDINKEDINGECPLVTAFYEDNFEIFKYLLECGADCNIKSNGNSLLSLAIDELNDTKYIKCLLKYNNLDINERDINECYPLIKAIKKNNINSVILLIKYGLRHSMDMNVIDIDGNTPLILSYRLNHHEIFKFLIRYLDVDRKDSNGNTLLYYAIMKGDIDTMEYLIDIGADINCKYSSGGKSALDLAISKGSKFLNILLNNKNNILLNVPNTQGETPLISIIKSSYYTIDDKKQIIKKMIQKGSNINFIDKDGNTPLIYALQIKSLPIIKLLIEHGAFINYTIEDSCVSTLMKAIGIGEIEIVKYLVECNANINYTNDFGNTPLAYAISVRNEEIVKYLIECGADINHRNYQGQTLYNVNRNYNFNNSNNSYTDIGKRINKLLGFY